MIKGFVNNEIWYSANAELASNWKLSDENELRVYQSLNHAFYEVCIGLAQFLPHKKSVVFMQNVSCLNESVISWFQREAYHIQQQELHKSMNHQEWVDALKKDVLCVVLYDDHIFTSEKYNHDHLEQLLNEKKIYCIRVSHSTAKQSTSEVQSYSCRVFPVNDVVSASVLGKKVKPPIQIAPYIFKPQIFQIDQNADESSDVIKKFESSLPEEFKAYISSSERYWNRCLFYHDVLHPDYIADMLAEKLSFKRLPVGQENRLETLTKCRWKNSKLFTDSLFLSQPNLQKCVMLSLALMRSDGDAIIQCLNEIRDQGEIQIL